jgi:hypothetical protein
MWQRTDSSLYPRGSGKLKPSFQQFIRKGILPNLEADPSPVEKRWLQSQPTPRLQPVRDPLQLHTDS